MRIPSWFAVLALVLCLSVPAPAQVAVKANRDPAAARLVTSDIPNFWKVFDIALLNNGGDLFQREYIDPGSPGLRDFFRSRIQNARYLAATVASRPKFYAAIRYNTLALDSERTVKDEIRDSFHKLKEIYPDAVFPDVYFVIGRLNSAGTVSANGLLIGVEMNARDDGTPVDELNDWEKAVTGQIRTLPHIVAHEVVHIQQAHGPANPTLLLQVLREGGADFIAELISGAHTNPLQHEYGNAHEPALWAEFRKDMYGTDASHWMFQGDRSKDRPADLGYYIGYKICQAFYQRTDDKLEAVRRIIRVTDADAFLKDSGYDPGER